MEKVYLKSHIDCIPLETHYLLNEKNLIIEKQQEQIHDLESKLTRLKDQYDNLLYLFRVTKNVATYNNNNNIDLQYQK